VDVVPKMLDTLIRVTVRNADDADRRTEALIAAMDDRLEKILLANKPPVPWKQDAPKPPSYVFNVKRGADGFITSIECNPK